MPSPAHTAAPLVVALGGNAISPGSERDSIAEQFGQTSRTMRALAPLLRSHRPVVMTHGNGPQVGAAILRAELSAGETYTLPLDIVVADLQGGMGYMIAQCAADALRRAGAERPVTAVVTTIEVDADDPSFHDPSKPVGPFYPADKAPDLERRGWRLVEVPGRGFRRVVASPRPRVIREIEAIRSLVGAGHVVVAAGGGGIPVTRDPDGAVSGREGVIDKDLCSALLARELGASLLLNVTDVPHVSLDFGTARERPARRLTVAEARENLEAGQFPRGSMGPKIEAGLMFLEAPARADARMVITNAAHIDAALEGSAGTTIVR